MGQSHHSTSDVVGLIPAAGRADRLGPLPCSKEILPLGFSTGEDGEPRPRAVCSYLLESFASSGVGRAFVLLRQGKWDIPALLGSGADHGLPLAYLALEPTASVPETLDRAYPFIAESTVALGFPDILFQPGDAYAALLAERARGGAEVVLGAFPTDQSWKADMVELDEADRVRRIVIKQRDTGLRFTWSIAVWGPRFSRYLHDYVGAAISEEGQEIYVGDVIQAAIDDRLAVAAVRFPEGSFLDVGTPEDLRRATARFAARELDR
ncbi:MAG: dTDP-glucose pyrophosphorylase [bacterium]|nr:dTDP-glucose pyrophosphorylase [bacterium]